MYLYLFLVGLVEVPAVLLLWPAITYLGRRITLAFLLIVCSVSLALMTLMMTRLEGGWRRNQVRWLSLYISEEGCRCLVLTTTTGGSTRNNSRCTLPHCVQFMKDPEEILENNNKKYSYVSMLDTVNKLLRCFETYPSCYLLGNYFILVLLSSSPSVPEAVKVLLSLIGKMTMTAAYHLLWVFTSEMFSTANRARVVGEASVVTKVVTVSVPYINHLMVRLCNAYCTHHILRYSPRL